MKRSTESLSLVLIGSVIAIGSYRSGDDVDANNGGPIGGGAMLVARSFASDRSDGGPTLDVSSRGGFGSSAFATVAG